jgi:UDP-glucose 4-epimerase
VGSHLVDRLLAEGTQVLVIDDLSTGRPENLAREVRLERLDIVTDDVERVLLTWSPTTVYHLAAQASVVASQRDPLRDLAVNVIGTQRVAMAALAAGARRLVFTSSGGAVYGETRRAATERTLPAPSSYYGVHKLAAEGHVRVIGLPSAIVRPSNIYGPRQTAGLEGAVIAAFVAQAADGLLRIDGDGRQTRDFIHVRDVADALWRLGQPEQPVGIWNVASGRRTSVRSLAEKVERGSGRPMQRVYGPRREGDVMHSALSSRQLRTATGWQPVVRLTDGIRELLAAVGESPRDRARSGASSSRWRR